MTELEILRCEILLGCVCGPNVIMRVLIGKGENERSNLDKGLKILQLCLREKEYNQNALYEILQVSTN